MGGVLKGPKARKPEPKPRQPDKEISQVQGYLARSRRGRKGLFSKKTGQVGVGGGGGGGKSKLGS